MTGLLLVSFFCFCLKINGTQEKIVKCYDSTESQVDAEECTNVFHHCPGE